MAPSSRVIICKTLEDLEEFIEDLNEYISRQDDEHALNTICADSIILRDRNRYNGCGAEVIRSERRDHWKPHKVGRVLDGAYNYDWDLKLAVTYTVSISMFDAKDREELRSAQYEQWLAEDSSVCPYLTVEYKSSEMYGKRSHAMNQTAAASILWMHQRKQVRDTLSKLLDDLRHYSVVIFDNDYMVSETRFEGLFYHIRTLAQGDLTKINNLSEYIGWSNSIHTWGLGTNATSFKEDIHNLLERERILRLPPIPEATHWPTNGSLSTSATVREYNWGDTPNGA